MVIPEVKYLLEEVQKVYGHRVSTSSDFELLSIAIEFSIGDSVSSSTLKRLWGYVHSSPKPRIATLDTLSKYVGKNDFRSFCEWLKSTEVFESTFFTAICACSSSLTAGDSVVIGWNPNRQVTMEYLGDNKFKVVDSVNSKLLVGDEFVVSEFILGYPLYISGILRDGEMTMPFLAGKKDGLTMISINGHLLGSK